MVKKTGSQAVVAALQAYGVRAVFGMPGVHNLALYDALCAHAELPNLAERLDAPVFTTALGKGAIPEDHPLAVGNRWTGDAELIKLLSESDVLLAVGTRFGATDTGQWKLELPSAIIDVDADAEELNRNVPAEVAVTGDAKTRPPPAGGPSPFSS